MKFKVNSENLIFFQIGLQCVSFFLVLYGAFISFSSFYIFMVYNVWRAPRFFLLFFLLIVGTFVTRFNHFSKAYRTKENLKVKTVQSVIRNFKSKNHLIENRSQILKAKLFLVLSILHNFKSPILIIL